MDQVVEAGLADDQGATGAHVFGRAGLCPDDRYAGLNRGVGGHHQVDVSSHERHLEPVAGIGGDDVLGLEVECPRNCELVVRQLAGERELPLSGLGLATDEGIDPIGAEVGFRRLILDEGRRGLRNGRARQCGLAGLDQKASISASVWR